MSAFFSASKNAFFNSAWKDDGSYSNDMWPRDAVQLSEQESDKYWKVSPPEGKMLGSTDDGRPRWVDIPPPSHAELVSKAEAHKNKLSYESEQSIRPLERAKQIGIATDEELHLLTKWEEYSVYLMRVDTSLAPDIEWPQKPQ